MALLSFLQGILDICKIILKIGCLVKKCQQIFGAHEPRNPICTSLIRGFQRASFVTPSIEVAMLEFHPVIGSLVIVSTAIAGVALVAGLISLFCDDAREDWPPILTMMTGDDDDDGR